MARIPWSRIREAFAGEWIELVDFSWKSDALHPSAGFVRHHSPDRKELLKRIHSSGKLEGSVVLFVGAYLPSAMSAANIPLHAVGA